MLQPVRGTKDLIGEDARLYRRVVDSAHQIAQRYNFQEIQTPIFEFASVFQRTLGETSDVVSKEMYTFEDRSGEVLTLRPEGTAPVIRSIISSGLTQSLPLKLFYAGPMFRYERPQKGRQRQFHQVGIELVGPKTPLADAEVIVLGYDVLRELGVVDSVELQINTLGDEESRGLFRDALVGYLAQYRNDLSADSQERLDKNPLRILDSKSEKDQEIIKGAPLFQTLLNDSSREYFQGVCTILEDQKVPFKINNNLVRGLDYYTHTAFEFVTNTLGAQGTVLAGGRYDHLMQQMGGPDTSGIGWAAGVERLCLMLSQVDVEDTQKKLISIIPATSSEEKEAFALTQVLRNVGLHVEMGYSGNMSKRLKKAAQSSARFVVICGEEMKQGNVVVKHLIKGSQDTVEIATLAEYFAKHNES